MSHDHFDQIWPNFWPNFGQTWPNFGQNFQKPKSDIYRVQKCLLSIFEKFGPFGPILEFGWHQNLVQWAKFFKNWNQAFLYPIYVPFLVFENFDQNLAKFGQNLAKNLVKFGQNGHVKSIGHEYSQNPKFQFKILFCSKVMHMSGF